MRKGNKERVGFKHYSDYVFYFIVGPTIIAFSLLLIFLAVLADGMSLIVVGLALLIPLLHIVVSNRKARKMDEAAGADDVIACAKKIARVGGVKWVVLTHKKELQGNALFPFTISHSVGWVKKAFTGGEVWLNAYLMMIGHETMHKLFPLKRWKWKPLSPARKCFVLNAEEAFCDFYGAVLAGTVATLSWSDIVEAMRVKVADACKKTDIFHPAWSTRLSVIERGVFDLDTLRMLAREAGMKVDSSKEDIDFMFNYWKDLESRIESKLFLVRLSDLAKDYA